MKKGYLSKSVNGGGGLTDLETMVLLGSLVVASNVSTAILDGKQDTGPSAPVDVPDAVGRWQEFLKDAFAYSNSDAVLQYKHWEKKGEGSHAGGEDVMKWVVQERDQIVALRKSLRDFLSNLYKDDYSDCTPDPEQMMDLFEAAQLIHHRSDN